MKKLTKKSGIYKITCICNDILYIGSACNIQRRHNEHYSKFRRNAHENKRMQNCFNKYGEENMIFEVIEIVKNDNPLLLKREQYYMDINKSYNYKFGFNIAPKAGNCKGVKHSEETKRKISEIQKGRKLSEEHKKKISDTTIGRPGKPHSEETRQKQREAKLKNPTRYWLGKKHSEETRKKISEVQKGKIISEETRLKKSKRAIFIDPSGNEIEVINITKFCRENNLQKSGMCALARGKFKQYLGYTLKEGY